MKIPSWIKAPFAPKDKVPEIPTLELSQAIRVGVRREVDSLDFSEEGTSRNQSDWETIQELKKTVMKQSIALGKSSRSTRFLVAVSFATGVALSGAGATLYGQSSPDSPLQAAMSLLAKKLSSGKTGYDMAIESGFREQSVQSQKALAESQETEIARLKKMIGLYEEMTEIQKKLIAGFQEKTNPPAVVKAVTAHVPAVDASPASKPLLELPHLEEVFDQVSQTRDSVLAGFQDPNLQIRVRRAQNHVHVYLVHHGKDSLGFYADMPQFAHRITAAGMRQWAGESIAQLQTVDAIQSLALARNIGNPELSNITMQTRRLYSGGVEVTIKDSFSGRTGKFKVATGASHADTVMQMEGVLASFLD